MSSTTVLGVKSSYASHNNECSYIVVIVDLNHGSVRASAETFHTEESEHAVGSGLAVLNAELLGQGLENLFGAAEHARSGATRLDEELADLLPTH